jgi:hypothetical protein
MKASVLAILVLSAFAFTVAGCSGPSMETKDTQKQACEKCGKPCDECKCAECKCCADGMKCDKCSKPCAECKCPDCKCATETKPVETLAVEQKPAEEQNPPAEQKPAEEQNPPAEQKPAENPPAPLIQAFPYDPSQKEVDDALKAMQLENAPTLGPVLKEWLLASYKRDFAKAYGYISTGSKGVTIHIAQVRIFSDKNAVAAGEKQLEDPNIDASLKKAIEEEITKLKEYIAGREACNNDGEKLYAYITDWVARGNQHNPIHGYVYGPPLKIVKEVFQGDVGYILTSDPPGANKMYFVKEKDGWKYDFANTVQIKDENDPPAQPQQVIPMQPAPQG